MFDFSQIDEVRLGRGQHSSPEAGMCFMEMVSWFAGEKHSDQPKCACPVLGAYGIRLNDSMPDDLRDRLLKPLVPLIAGTADKASEHRRAEFLAMWAVNRVLPILLRARGFADHAKACEDARTLAQAKSAANAADADAAAYAAADAAAYAASASAAAYAASASAAADAAAYAASASAAYAASASAADAAAYAASAAKIWKAAAEGLRHAILIGRHDGFSEMENIIVERRQKLRELVG
jgi:hypothetical protein